MKLKYQNDDNVILNNCAVSDSVGLKIFHSNVFHPSSSLEETNSESEFLKTKSKILGVEKENLIIDKYDVECTTINDYCTAKNIFQVDLLKIDIEGHEQKVLTAFFDSLSSVNVLLIQLEDHLSDLYNKDSRERALIELVLSNRYKQRKKFKHVFRTYYDRLYERVID